MPTTNPDRTHTGPSLSDPLQI